MNINGRHVRGVVWEREPEKNGDQPDRKPDGRKKNKKETAQEEDIRNETWRIDDRYPPRDGYDVSRKKLQTLFHNGYWSPNARPCLCGAQPVFEQYVHDVDPETGARNIPAQKFVAICPMCELRAEGEGDLEYVLEQWNKRHWSQDSLMVRIPMKDLSMEHMLLLAGVVVGGQVEQAIALIQNKHGLTAILQSGMLGDIPAQRDRNKIRQINHSLNQIEDFFRTSPLMGDRDPDAVLSMIRKRFHPGDTREEIDKRMEIPLHLRCF